jgi:hypothetical protein
MEEGGVRVEGEEVRAELHPLVYRHVNLALLVAEIVCRRIRGATLTWL